MCDNKTVGIEVWPVAADSEAIWLAGRDAWRDGPLKADTTVHFAVQQTLYWHGIDPDDALFVKVPEGTPQAGVIHSTSWRDAGPGGRAHLHGRRPRRRGTCSRRGRTPRRSWPR